jgi:hypothetical protein
VFCPRIGQCNNGCLRFAKIESWGARSHAQIVESRDARREPGSRQIESRGAELSARFKSTCQETVYTCDIGDPLQHYRWIRSVSCSLSYWAWYVNQSTHSGTFVDPFYYHCHCIELERNGGYYVSAIVRNLRKCTPCSACISGIFTSLTLPHLIIRLICGYRLVFHWLRSLQMIEILGPCSR